MFFPPIIITIILHVLGNTITISKKGINPHIHLIKGSPIVYDFVTLYLMQLQLSFAKNNEENLILVHANAKFDHRNGVTLYDIMRLIWLYHYKAYGKLDSFIKIGSKNIIVWVQIKPQNFIKWELLSNTYENM